MFSSIFHVAFDILTVVLAISLLVYVRKFRRRLSYNIERQTADLQRSNESTGALHLVISIGKCGGSTLGTTLREAFHPLPIPHVHVISQKGMTLAADTWLHEAADQRARDTIIGHLKGAQMARVSIEERRARYGRPIGYYTCGVREPVALAVSGYFQSFDPRRPIEGFSLENAYKEVLEHPVFTNSGMYLDGLDAWFDREIKDVLGIDVFQHSFDQNNGYQLIDSNGVRLLVIRQENFHSLSQAFGNLYRSPEQLFIINDYNRTKDKAFHSTYAETVSKIRFTKKHLDAVYQTRYARHFYSEEEIESFRNKWLE